MAGLGSVNRSRADLGNGHGGISLSGGEASSYDELSK